jgi:hypothetical protein
MPGEERFVEEFIQTHLFASPEQRLLGQLFRRIVEAMDLAGEAGLLLKIEVEIASAVAEAKEDWIAAVSQEQRLLFSASEEELAVVGDGKSDFWEVAEGRIYEALRAYAETVSGDNGAFQRRLFASDVAHGFAFIDLCRNRYDVAVMNPPFGDSTSGFLDYLAGHYPLSKHELSAAFIERLTGLCCSGGLVGWISPRTWFSSSLLAGFRQDLIYSQNRIAAVVDLGIGVLDAALVETAACTLTVGDDRSPDATVFRLLASRNKESDTLESIRCGRSVCANFARLQSLPRAAFGYWFPAEFSAVLASTPAFQQGPGTAKQGLATTDDFRFLRAIWEVPANTIGFASRWVPFAKGGEYEPYFDDLHLVIDWEDDGRVLKNYLVYNKGQAHWSRRIASAEYYGRPGLTYPERTTSDLSLRPLPAGSIFSATGQAVFLSSSEPDREQMLAYLGLSYTRIFKQLVELFVGGGDASESGSAARHYTSGILNEIPVPSLTWEDVTNVPALVEELVEIRRRETRGDEVSFEFLSSPLCRSATSLREAADTAQQSYFLACRRSLELAEQLEQWSYELYGLDPDLADDFLREEICTFPNEYPSTRTPSRGQLEVGDVSALITAVSDRHGYRRAFTKKGYWANRALELASHLFGENPANCGEFTGAFLSRGLQSPVPDLVSYCVGSSFGRWDLRVATDGRTEPTLPDVFAPLPACPPGQLQNERGLPITPADAARLEVEGRWDYPIEIPWNGILVDDPGHALDVEARIHQVLRVVWKDRWEAIEREACEILGVRSLRDYFRKPGGIFADHLQRYSKSRRQAPIYWPLSTPSGSYTLWVYYHRLTDQTLYICVNDFVEPRLKQVAEDASRLRTKSGRSSAEEKELERLSDLEAELRDFRDELLRIARFWKPDLNDGVQITAAPLWKLFQHKPWQKKLRETWEKLEDGDYDWAHLAYSIWPERVREACRTDKSLAIAHRLEELYEEPKGSAKKKRGRRKAAEVEELKELFDAD